MASVSFLTVDLDLAVLHIVVSLASNLREVVEFNDSCHIISREEKETQELLVYVMPRFSQKKTLNKIESLNSCAGICGVLDDTLTEHIKVPRFDSRGRQRQLDICLFLSLSLLTLQVESPDIGVIGISS